MSVVKMGLEGLNAEGVHTKLGGLIENLTGNLNFPTPEPPLATLTGVNSDLWDAILLAQSKDKTAVQLRQDRMEIAIDTIRLLAGCIQFQSNGVAAKILSSGFDVKEHGGPIGPLMPPQSPVVSYIEGRSGELKFDWSGVHGAFSYNLYQSTNPLGPFVAIGSTGKSRYIITSLVPGTRYYFCVAALGANGEGGMSAVISKMAV